MKDSPWTLCKKNFSYFFVLKVSILLNYLFLQDDYLERLESWHESRTIEEMEEDGLFEELDGGLKVPVAIWKRLYHYQKVSSCST